MPNDEADTRRAWVFTAESAFRKAVRQTRTRTRLRRPDIGWVLLQVAPEEWLAVDANALANRLEVDSAPKQILDWLRSQAEEATPDFDEGTLRFADEAHEFDFVISGARLPGKGPTGPPGDENYICDRNGHKVRRPRNSTGSVCPVELEGGQRCPGILRVF